MYRGDKMSQLVEGHNITVPKKRGGREALFTDFKKSGGYRPPHFATPKI